VLYVALESVLSVIEFDQETAVVVLLEHTQLRDNVPLLLAINVKVGVLLVRFVIVPVVITGAVMFR
jgi:hypothetical protein